MLYRTLWVLSVSLMVLVLSITWNCTKRVPGPTGPQGKDGPTGPTGPTGPQGSQTRVGVHVITFGDPSDTSAPNSGGLLVNDVVVWDTITTVPGVFTVRVPGTSHPDDITEVFLGGGSRGRLRHHFEADAEGGLIEITEQEAQEMFGQTLGTLGPGGIVYLTNSNEFVAVTK